MDRDKIFAEKLMEYIKQRHTQDEIIGYIDGLNEALNFLVCEHNRVNVEPDNLGNTHYCSKCGQWNF